MHPTALTAAPLPPLSIRFDDRVPVLEIPPDLDYEALRAWLRQELPGQIGAIGGRSSRLDIGTRTLVLFDLRRLLNLLRTEFSVEVTGLYADGQAIHRYAERELKLKLFVHDPVSDELPEELAATDEVVTESEDVPQPAAEALPATPLPAPERRPIPHDVAPEDLDEEDAKPPEPRTRAIHGTLRSGAVVRFDGDLYVYGDVNPGAHVVSTGNIVVLGALKGMAHAGAAGDDDAFILAFQLRPTQLRIARKIAIPPDRPDGRDFTPEIASIQDHQIVLEPYRGRAR